MADKIYDCFRKNRIKDIIVSLIKAEDALMRLPLNPDQREKIDVGQIISLLRECNSRIAKMEKYRKKYKRFKRKYLDLRALIRINDTVSRKDVLDAIKYLESINPNTCHIDIDRLKEMILGLSKSPKIIKEEKHEN